MRLLPLLLVSFFLIYGTDVSAKVTITGNLQRNASLGFVAFDQAGKLQVARVYAGTEAEKQGIKPGDVITSINGKAFDKAYHGQAVLEKLPAEKRVRFAIESNGKSREIEYTPPPKPYDEFSGFESIYGVVDVPDGSRLRTIITRPEGVKGKLPAVFFVQWVSCNSIEMFNRTADSWGMIRSVITRSKVAFIRVERTPSGDSIGPACHALDADTEIAHYRHAFDQVMQLDFIDRNRVIVWGDSLGSTLAPLVIDNRKVAGVVIGGGGSLTFVERMIDFDRIHFEMGEFPVEEINDRMLRHIEFHTEYLIRGKTPEEIIKTDSSMKEVWSAIRGAGDGVHYGRPYAYHQQLAKKNFLAAWAKIDAPVLVHYSEFDQFETSRGHKVVAETINKLHPGQATYLFLPKMNHFYDFYPTFEESYVEKNGVPGFEFVGGIIVNWMNEVLHPG